MSEVSVHPIAQGGFDTSQIYDQVRPSYSKDVVNFLLDKLGIATFDASSNQPLRILELGAGTGKFTATLQEVLRDSKVQIIASEPLLSMREEFKKRHPDIDILDCLAESIGKCFLCYINNSFWRENIKQLLAEVEHDIMNYQNRGLCYLPKPKAEADNTGTRFW